MLFEVKVSQKFALFNSFTVKQVEAPSAEIAAAFVLAKTKKEFPDEKHLYVSRVAEIGDQFIGKATQPRVQPTSGRRGKNKGQVKAATRG